jgi:hypothetical protein
MFYRVITISFYFAFLACAVGDEIGSAISLLNEWKKAHPDIQIQIDIDYGVATARQTFYAYHKNGVATWLEEFKTSKPVPQKYYTFPNSGDLLAFWPSTQTLVKKASVNETRKTYFNFMNYNPTTLFDISELRVLAKSINVNKRSSEYELAVDLNIEPLKKLGYYDDLIKSALVKIYFACDGQISKITNSINDLEISAVYSYVSFDKEEIERAIPSLPDIRLLDERKSFAQAAEEATATMTTQKE